jgi:hypothetical protein
MAHQASAPGLVAKHLGARVATPAVSCGVFVLIDIRAGQNARWPLRVRRVDKEA